MKRKELLRIILSVKKKPIPRHGDIDENLANHIIKELA
jgi:hypothetical protein